MQLAPNAAGSCFRDDRKSEYEPCPNEAELHGSHRILNLNRGDLIWPEEWAEPTRVKLQSPCLVDISPANPHNISCQLLLSFPFYGWETETQRGYMTFQGHAYVSVRAWVHMQVHWLQESQMGCTNLLNFSSNLDGNMLLNHELSQLIFKEKISSK